MEWQLCDDNVVEIRCDIPNSTWTQKFLKLADVHFDSPYCDRSLLRKLLDQAKEESAPVSIYGDWFDAMQSRDDPRRSMKELRKEYAGEDAYADFLVDESVEFLRPYADIILNFGRGNHDTKVIKFLHTDVVRRLCRELDVPDMGYSGFEIYKFEFTYKGKGKGSRTSRSLFFHHGKEGGSVNKGTQRAARWQDWVRADVYVGGHIHQEWQMTRPYVSVTTHGKVLRGESYHISLPTFKDEWNLRGGYAIEKAMAPSPMGGAWLVFGYNRRLPNRLSIDFHRAR